MRPRCTLPTLMRRPSPRQQPPLQHHLHRRLRPHHLHQPQPHPQSRPLCHHRPLPRKPAARTVPVPTGAHRAAPSSSSSSASASCWPLSALSSSLYMDVFSEVPAAFRQGASTQVVPRWLLPSLRMFLAALVSLSRTTPQWIQTCVRTSSSLWGHSRRQALHIWLVL